MTRLPAAVLIAAAVLALAGFVSRGAAAERLAAGFLRLREVDPTILSDIRYATTDNFTGAPVPGYLAGDCVLLREVAQALKRVQDDLRGRGLSLKVYDCYRPLRAVKSFMLWVHGAAARGQARYFPRTGQRDLIRLGYIAAQSVHSTGAAIDLTIVALPAAPAPAFDPHAAYGPCNGAKASREPDNSIDMGTSFDCFDRLSYTASSEITADQRANRRMLVAAMEARGFKNYSREWWHFSFPRTAEPREPRDFVVTK